MADVFDKMADDYARNAEACGENPAAGGCLICAKPCGVKIYCGDECRAAHQGGKPVYRAVAVGNSDPIEGMDQ